MGLFSDIFTGIFGGGTASSSEKSVENVRADNLARQRAIEKATGTAIGDVKKIIPEALRVGSEGFQGALDIIGQGISPQIDAFQQGNIGAQEITAETLPLVMAAILGTGGGTGGTFDPRSINVDPSFLEGVQAPIATDVFAPSPPRTPSLSRGIFDFIGRGGGGIDFSGGNFINENIGNFEKVLGPDGQTHFITSPNQPIGGNVTNPFVLDRIEKSRLSPTEIPPLTRIGFGGGGGFSTRGIA